MVAHLRLHATVALVLAAAACGGSAAAGNGTHVDSVVPWDTALARFREGSDPVQAFAHAAPSRDELIRQFVEGVEARDTIALARLALSRAEFGWLYYPWVPEAHPPYDLSPGLMWFMLEGNSRRGLTAALEERGGRALGFLGYDCAAQPRRFGENTVWPLCVVRRLQSPGDTLEERLFGPIVERGGRFKFVSLANKL